MAKKVSKGHQILLHDGEKKIVAALAKLEKLWQREGQDLVLHNGNSLRKEGLAVVSFKGINGNDSESNKSNFNSVM